MPPTKPSHKKNSNVSDTPNATEERHKQIATAFYEAALNRHNFEDARQYMGTTYTQHNPNASDSPEGLPPSWSS